MIEEGLSSKLWALSKKILEKAREYRDSDQAIKTSRLYMKARVVNFDYKEGNISFGISYDYVKKEELHWKDQFDFIEMFVKQFREHEEVVAEVLKKYKVNESQAEFWLSRFEINLTDKALGNVTEETLVDYITTFITDLEKSPIEWKLKIWINGIWLEKDEYEIHSGLKIRKLMPSDLEIARPLNLASIEEAIESFDMVPPFLAYRFEKIPTSVLELADRFQDEVEIGEEIETVLNCLRLFKLGSVFSVKAEMEPKSILRLGGASFPGLMAAPIYKYCIREQDVPILRDFIREIKPVLPRENSRSILGKIEPISISLQRYKDALLKPESIESRITSAITCFEALYLKAEERAELSHRLGERAAALLGIFNFPPLEVYNTIKRAYNIRSAFIHGSQTETSELESAGRLARKTLEYARVSLLLFLQLRRSIEKNELISKMDNSLLNADARSKLQRFVNENCRVYVLAS